MAVSNTIRRDNLDYQEHPVASIIGSIIPSLLVGGCLYWFTGWQLRRKKDKIETSNQKVSHSSENDHFYEQVAEELKSQKIIPGLWTKAFAEMGGDDTKVRALYIKFRVAQLAAAANEKKENERQQTKEATKNRTGQLARALFYKFLVCVFIALAFICLFIGGVIMYQDHSGGGIFAGVFCFAWGFGFVTAAYAFDLNVKAR